MPSKTKNSGDGDDRVGEGLLQKRCKRTTRVVTHLLCLPPEVLYDIAAHLDAQSVLSWSHACTCLHALLTDDSLWHDMFQRDLAHLYATGVPALPRTQTMEAAWSPERAAEAWGSLDPVGRMPPHIHADFYKRRCFPIPFSRAPALHRSWRWLYALHMRAPAATPPFEIAAMAGGSPTFTHLRRYCLVPSYLGDLSPDGMAHGYGVVLYRVKDSSEVVAWTEALWIDGRLHGWAIDVDAAGALYSTIERHTRAGFAFYASATGHQQDWACIQDGRYHGKCVQIKRPGAVSVGQWRGGARMCDHTVYEDGSAAYFSYVWDRRDGHGISLYANGDTVHHTWYRGALQSIDAFVTSPRCPDAGLALQHLGGNPRGRAYRDALQKRLADLGPHCDPLLLDGMLRSTGDLQEQHDTVDATDADAGTNHATDEPDAHASIPPLWRWVITESSPGVQDYVYWLHGDSSDARTFRRYVLGGHVGWPSAVWRAALDHLADP